MDERTQGGRNGPHGEGAASGGEDEQAHGRANQGRPDPLNKEHVLLVDNLLRMADLLIALEDRSLLRDIRRVMGILDNNPHMFATAPHREVCPFLWVDDVNTPHVGADVGDHQCVIEHMVVGDPYYQKHVCRCGRTYQPPKG